MWIYWYFSSNKSECCIKYFRPTLLWLWWSVIAPNCQNCKYQIAFYYLFLLWWTWLIHSHVLLNYCIPRPFCNYLKTEMKGRSLNINQTGLLSFQVQRKCIYTKQIINSQHLWIYDDATFSNHISFCWCENVLIFFSCSGAIPNRNSLIFTS